MVDVPMDEPPAINRFLTILVPNYNRPEALGRLLESVFKSISHATAWSIVDVLVVDDHSEADISPVIETFKCHENFHFDLQEFKCGNAEVAFLTAMKKVKTEYVWLLGNDDEVLISGVGKIIHLLRYSPSLSLILLNPNVTNMSTGKNFIPLQTTTETVLYERAEDLFYDFGFVTSTTTFPCLVMRTEPIRQFHNSFNLLQYGNVYSHTFTMFGAFHNQPALFVSTPLIRFTLNERIEEQAKLEKQSPAGIMFYHQAIGLTRLIRASARITGIDVKTIMLSFEDEVDKDENDVHPTFLSHFIAHFFMEQLIREQENVHKPTRPIGNMVRSEVDEIMSIIIETGDEVLRRFCVDGLEAYNWQSALPAWKVTYLRLAQKSLRELVIEKYKDHIRRMPMNGPKKIAPSTFLMIPLRGSAGDANGVPKTSF